MRAWKDVAVLVKAKSSKGRFVVRPAAGLPFLLEEGMEVAFVPPRTDLPRRALVDFVGEDRNGSFEVGFDAVADDAPARGLVGSHCLVRRAELDESALSASPATWEGWKVVDAQARPVGDVIELIDTPGQALLSVARPDGRGEVLLPLADELVLDIDPIAQSIAMEVPAGLLDL